jgi:tetratricopeptide (TPR) repeat protein
VRILGEAQLLRGDSTQAIVTLERATALDREDAAAWDALARARLLSGRPDEAVDAALRARGLRPASKEFLVTCAGAMLAAGRDAEALEMLHDALFPLPGDPLLARAYADAHLQVARREASAGERGRARRRLLAGLEAVPKHEGCLELLDRLQKQFDAERPEADKLLVPGADGSVTLDRWMRHVAWLCHWGCYVEAGEHFDDMLKRVGSLAEVQYLRGREFWESRGTVEGIREAVASYRAAVARDPKHAESWNRLWRCLALLGKNDEAAQAARRFLEVAPEHPDGVDAEVFLGHEPGDPPDAPPRAGR